MKTISKNFQKAGNIALVQIETLEGEGFGFVAAEPVINQGDLVIKEVQQEGSVNTLLAINHTDHYCLLTDMDLLKGAKQNRVVNTSVLIAPNSKQEVEVSCVERSRWSYDSPTFKPAPESLDLGMRAAKAASLKSDVKGQVSETQSKIWGMIREEMISCNMMSTTEDYNYILESKKKESRVRHRFTIGGNFNGLALFEGKKLVSFDFFGNREVYRHYFERLTQDALSRVKLSSMHPAVEYAEAFFRLDEILDGFESQLDQPVKPKEGTIGNLHWSGDRSYPGFDLTFEDQRVHMAGFARNN